MGFRPRPGAISHKPSRPSSAKRFRHSLTVWRFTESSFAIATSDDPAAAAAQAAGEATPPQPTLYLHGTTDGAMGIDVIGPVTDHLADGSELVVLEGVGHFLHLERPELVNDHIIRFLQA